MSIKMIFVVGMIITSALVMSSMLLTPINSITSKQ